MDDDDDDDEEEDDCDGNDDDDDDADDDSGLLMLRSTCLRHILCIRNSCTNHPTSAPCSKPGVFLTPACTMRTDITQEQQ